MDNLKTEAERIQNELRDKQVGYVGNEGNLIALYHKGTEEPYLVENLVRFMNLNYGKNVENTTKLPRKPFKQGHRKRIFNSLEIEKIKRMYYEDNMSKREIAKIMKVSHPTIIKYLQEEYTRED